MFSHEFQHETIRKLVIVFGTLFNNIVINRRTSAGVIDQRIKVPIAYGPRSKVLARLEQNPDLDNPVAISLPRMSFEITSMTYAAERKKITTGRNIVRDPTSDNRHMVLYNSVPYDIGMQLNILTKNFEDATQIVEQIVPFFTPDWTVTMEHVDGFGAENLPLDVPIVLTSVSNSEEYEGNFEERRAVIWTLDFVIKANFFGPQRAKSVIKFVDTRVRSVEERVNPDSRLTVQPGLTSGGLPTTDVSLTVPYSAIEESDNWDFIIQTTNPPP